MYIDVTFSRTPFCTRSYLDMATSDKNDPSAKQVFSTMTILIDIKPYRSKNRFVHTTCVAIN